MSVFYSGINGSLSVDGKRLGKVTDWTLNGSAETAEVTKLDDYAPRYRTLRQSYSGDCSVFYYKDDNDSIESAGLIGGVIRTGRIDPDQTYEIELRSSDMALKFDAVLTDVRLGASAGDVMKAEVSFNVNGPLTSVELGGN